MQTQATPSANRFPTQQARNLGWCNQAKSENWKPTHTDWLIIPTQAILSANMFPIKKDDFVCTFTKKFAQEAKWTDLALHTMQAGQTQPGS